MDEILQFLANGQGLYDLGSIVKLFLLMVGMDGVIAIIYAFFKAISDK